MAQPDAHRSEPLSAMQDVVFLVDCDNTLLDNDVVEKDLRDHLAQEFGPANRDRYWAILEQLRSELGYADYLGALQRYRLDDMSDTRLLQMSSFLVDYPFESRLYPGALAVIRHLQRPGIAGHSVGWRCGIPASQDSALRALGRGGGPGADLHSQGADAGCRRRALSGPALRHDRRQAADPGDDESDLGGPSDDSVPASGTLCGGPSYPQPPTRPPISRSSGSGIWSPGIFRSVTSERCPDAGHGTARSGIAVGRGVSRFRGRAGPIASGRRRAGRGGARWTRGRCRGPSGDRARPWRWAT